MEGQGMGKAWKRLMGATVLGLGLCGFCFAQRQPAPNSSESWDHPEGVFVSEPQMLMNDPYTGNFQSRFLYLNGRLNDGTVLTFSIFNWKYGMLGASGVMVLVAPPQGETYALEREIDKDELVTATDRLYFHFGGNVVEGSRTELHIRLLQEDFACDLRARNILNPWQAGDGYTYLTPRRDIYSRYVAAAPLASLSGYMVVRGRVIPADGYCYSDRGVLVRPFQNMNAADFSFRAFSAQVDAGGQPWTVSVLHSITDRAFGSREMSTLFLAHGERWIMAADSFSFSAEEYVKEQGTPFAYPHRMQVRAARGGYTLEGSFSATRLFYLSDILEKLPPFIRAVVDLFLRRPVTYRMTGYFSGSLLLPDGSRQSLYLAGQGEYSIYK
jgi:hypothetical protein